MPEQKPTTHILTLETRWGTPKLRSNDVGERELSLEFKITPPISYEKEKRLVETIAEALKPYGFVGKERFGGTFFEFDTRNPASIDHFVPLFRQAHVSVKPVDEELLTPPVAALDLPPDTPSTFETFMGLVNAIARRHFSARPAPGKSTVAR